MLQPRESDLPVLFLTFVVLPLVAYVLLGKWSEAAKKKERISVLAQIAAEEAFRAESMAAAAAAIPLVPPPNNVIHECARCFAPATTRCSRCKSVRYCSGKCQIIHWRQVHKLECQILEYNSSTGSPRSSSYEESIHGSVLLDDNMDFQCIQSSIEHPGLEKIAPNDTINIPSRTAASATSTCMTVNSTEFVVDKTLSEMCGSHATNRERLERVEADVSESSREAYVHRDAGFTLYNNASSKETVNRHKKQDSSNNETAEVEYSCEKSSMKRSNTTKIALRSHGTNNNSAKLTAVSRDQSCLDLERNHFADESKVARVGDTESPAEWNGAASKGFIKMVGLRRSSKHDRLEQSGVNVDCKKIKMLFPYEEFMNLFQYEVFDILPRGLVNVGNSCYANAVLQCLTCTKPLAIYLLRKSHSRACCVNDWCLMCELEQHVMMLRESGGPLSLSRLLVHMQSANCQIGNGSQEDAHEFLRLLVTKMQSKCLEGLGGEGVVDTRLQETTFIQHTFGGRLRSKVKCLRCHHVSERYENIMDLTLEIFGWVESLEDALTQFTSPEDLDGDNMYRCGRCAAYVRAQKQLCIQEAPNILTIVLKRFQEGSYGKINKCISFPDMLDMIPFMTGTGDIPPLYMLYAVVVHLDTMNASFSGHYISYVKDVKGNWFRIDDTQVQPVPPSQVMSEGAYILFYMRSCPRPSGAGTKKPTRHQDVSSQKHVAAKVPKSSSDHKQSTMGIHGSSNRRTLPMPETYAKSSGMDISDATSISDWSIFTSSDDASFTTDSTRDSFSTVDYSDASNIDPISSIFNTNFYMPHDYPSHKVVLNRGHSGQPPYRIHKGENGRQVRVPATEALSSGRSCGVYVKSGSRHKDGLGRTSGQCTL